MPAITSPVKSIEVTGQPPPSGVLFRASLYLLLAYLASIIIIGKGPTYLGVPPLFWGEVVMLFGLIYLAFGKPDHPWLGLKYGWLSWSVLAWMALGLVRTASTFGQWGLDAIRDAAIWYYGLCFFVGLGLATRKYWADKTWRVVQIFWILAMFWGTANWLLQDALTTSGPMLPWRGVHLFYNARDELAQNAAMGSLIVLCFTNKSRIFAGFRPVLLPVALLGLALFSGSEGRAVKVAFAVATMVSLTLLSAPRRPILPVRRYGSLMLAGIPVVILLFLFVPHMAEKMQLDRFGEGNKEGQDTKEWRAIWWRNLYRNVLNQNPAFGLGFGQSLHIYHPMIGDSDDEWGVRSPHNFNMTVFSRMGIVGITLLAVVVIGGFLRLYILIWRGQIKGQAYSDERREELTFWLFVLVCTYVNSSMGVLMEGPVLGILFWWALGFSFGRSLSTGAPSLSPGTSLLKQYFLHQDLQFLKEAAYSHAKQIKA